MRAACWMITVLLLPAGAEAVDLAASGGVTRMVNSSHLAAGAGSNLAASFVEAAATTLDLSNAGSQTKWRIDVRRSDSNWNSGLRLFVKRVSDGSGSGTVTGGLSFIEVTGFDRPFFTGTGDLSGLSLSYQLTGMTVAVAPETYSTTVSFAAVSIP